MRNATAFILCVTGLLTWFVGGLAVLMSAWKREGMTPERWQALMPFRTYSIFSRRDWRLYGVLAAVSLTCLSISAWLTL